MKKKLATKKRLFAPCSHCVNECTHQPIQVLIADGSAEAEDEKYE